MSPQQLLTNPVYHWYPANIYHKTFNRSTHVDTHTDKSPAPTNICSQCGQVIVPTTTEEARPVDPQKIRRENVTGVIFVSLALILSVIFVWCKLREEE